jgi:hypothetical protein
MEALFLLLLVLATPSVIAAVWLWACLLMAARSEALPPPEPEWE